MNWRGLITWGSTLACAVLTWTIFPTSSIGWCLVLLSMIMTHSLISVLYDGLARARERARLSGKVKAGALDQSELPSRLIRFPTWTIVVGLLYWAALFALNVLISGSASLSVRASSGVGVLCAGVGIAAVLITLYTIVKLALWILAQSTETAFTAAEALRRRKLKETIYAESDGDPLDVSDLRGDVSVGDDGELIDSSKWNEENR